MNFTRRAWKYLQQNKVKKCMVGVMFLCISLLFWGTRSMKERLNEELDELTDSLTANVTIYREKGGMTSYDETATFPYKCAEEIMKTETPKSVSFVAEVNCFGEDVEGIIPDYELSQKASDSFYASEAEKKAGPFNLIGVADSGEYSVFRQGKYDIVEGRGIEEGDRGKPYAVVSGRFLMRNRLKLGDTFVVSSCFDREKKEKLTIVGVHSGDFVGTKSWESECNNIYTPLENVYALNNDKVLRMQMELTDVKNLDKRIRRMEETGEKNGVKFSILKDNMKYLNAVNPMESMKNMCDRTWEAVLLVAASILVVVNIFEIIKRKKEIGILISLGEKIGKIAIQLLMEQLVPILLGMGLGTILWVGFTRTCQLGEVIFLLGYGIGVAGIVILGSLAVILLYEPRQMLQS